MIPQLQADLPKQAPVTPAITQRGQNARPITASPWQDRRQRGRLARLLMLMRLDNRRPASGQQPVVAKTNAGDATQEVTEVVQVTTKFSQTQ